MSEFNEKWMNDIRFRMDNHSEPLPADMWERIEAEISTPKIIPMWRKWYSVAAAAAVIAIVSSVSVILWNRNIDENTVKIAETAVPVINDDFVSKPVDNPVLAVAADSEKSVTPETVMRRYAEPVALKEIEETPVEEISVEEPVMATAVETPSADEAETMSEELPSQDNAARKRIDMMKADREVQRQNASYLAMSGSSNKSGNNGIQVGLTAGNTPYNSSNSFTGISRLSSRKMAVQTNDIVISEASEGDVTYSQVLFNNRDKVTYTDVKHHMPISVGANVKWNLNEKWGIETGLGYTYLYSELRSGANSYIKDNQKLHYVGVPLKLHRSIWGNKVLSFYASAGGMVEKCVSGDIETMCVDDERGSSYESESIGEKPWQFSVAASLGAQVNFLKFMSLYVEPGMAYYFDDGSELMTIRKDKPFNFNLQFGLRFNIGR